MSAYSPASEVVLRHAEEFEAKRVLFAGDLQDTLAADFAAQQVKAHCGYFHQWQRLSAKMQTLTQFGLVPEEAFVGDCDTLIYFWPKSKQEAHFQLSALLHLLPVGCDIFVVGENRAGVRSVESLFSEQLQFNKIDSARRCGFYYAHLSEKGSFALAPWWQSYCYDGLTIKTLPGVFSRDKLDVGSELLLTTLKEVPLKGNLLDVGCGAGVLSAVLKSLNPELNLTLIDVNSAALASSEATLAVNNFTGHVLPSDVFSEIKQRYHVIISNPPFHDGIQTNLAATSALIRQAKDHLEIGGKLVIVANAFLPYPDILDETFRNHEVLAQTSKFKVYSATRLRPIATSKPARRR